MDNYKYAKSLLFSQLGNEYGKEEIKYAVLNVDDPASDCFSRITSESVIRYGINEEADVRARNVMVDARGTHFYWKPSKGLLIVPPI